MAGMAAGGPQWWVLGGWILALSAVGGAYAGGVRRLTVREVRWPVRRSFLFASGLGALAAATVLPPLAQPADFPQHVAGHLLLGMLGPLAVILGAPITLALRALAPPGRHLLLRALRLPVSRLLLLPPVLVLMDLGGMFLYYLTPLFEAAQRHSWLHLLVDLHMVVAGCLLTAYLAAADPFPGRSTTTVRMLVLAVSAGAHDLLAKLMYGGGAPAGAGDPDQLRLGAELLYYGGDAVELLLATVVMLQWYARGGRELRRAARRRADAGAGPTPL